MKPIHTWGIVAAAVVGVLIFWGAIIGMAALALNWALQ